MPARVDIPAERSFIGAWFLDDPTLCDSLLALYHASPAKVRGQTVDRQGAARFNPEYKDSYELTLYPDNPHPLLVAYTTELQKVVDEYMRDFPYCDQFAAWTIVEPVNIQFYPKGGGYKQFHAERISAVPPNANRHLVFMTYLNDVFDQGGTEFLHQQVIVPARKGLTVIWPADWTHTHRGIVSDTEEKAVITGWFSYV